MQLSYKKYVTAAQSTCAVYSFAHMLLSSCAGLFKVIPKVKNNICVYVSLNVRMRACVRYTLTGIPVLRTGLHNYKASLFLVLATVQV
jgi:hypothetical protein